VLRREYLEDVIGMGDRGNGFRKSYVLWWVSGLWFGKMWFLVKYAVFF
jgi:hypothetical protein